MYDQAALLADLETSLSKRPSNWRASALRQLIALFLAGSERLSSEHVALYDLVLPRLMDDVDHRTLADISTMLANSPNAPRRTIELLAKNKSASVAGPVLQASACVSNGVLIEIAAAAEPDILIGIARRASLSSSVTDALIERGDAAVNLEVFANRKASVSEMGYVQMIEEAKTNEMLLSAIRARQDIPAELRPFFEMAAKPAG